MPTRISLKTILVPTDWSDSSVEALNWATSLVETLQVTLHLLHVVEKPHLAVGGAELMSFSAPDLVGRMIRSAKARMTPLASEWESTFTIERAVRVGVPYVEIVRYAHEHHVDLIVMSTHDRGAVGHMLFGSLAERVWRRAPCTVLTVRQPGSHARFSGTKVDQAMRLGGRQSRAIRTTVTRPDADRAGTE